MVNGEWFKSKQKSGKKLIERESGTLFKSEPLYGNINFLPTFAALSLSKTITLYEYQQASADP